MKPFSSPMASTHFSVFSLHAPSNTRKTHPLIIVSSKTRHRKNYLRPKILKTLTKPSPPIPPPLPPPQPIVSPQEHALCVEVPAEDTHGQDIAGAVGEPVELEDLRVPEAAAENKGVFGDVSAAAIFKYGGMYLIGAFVFQTICSFWILGNSNSNQKDGDGDSKVSEREKRNLLFNGNEKTLPVTGAGNDFYTEDQLGMEKKIEEIKLMAREARRIELEKKGEEKEDGDTEIADESAVSSSKHFIEKEIGARLLKLQNRINSDKDNSAALRLNAHGNSAAGVVKDGDKNVNQGNEELMFKKRFKFKSHSTMATKTPKGFSGIQDRRTSKAKTRDDGSDITDRAGLLYEDKQGNQQDVTQKNTSGVRSEERGKAVDDESGAILNHGKNLEEKMEKPNVKTKAGFETKSINNGGVRETSVGMSSAEVTQSRDSKELRTQNSQDNPIFEKDNVRSVNGNSRHGLAKKNSAANRVKVKQANTKTDMWWLNLSYVLVILMQRGSNGEVSKGFYSLKLTSKEQKQEQSDDSYTVAFEDHADANNYCFLLESFFEDLGDFSANAVPMSIQELNEEIKSHAKKVVVVKKRQLQLYAGQPLTDVESALCSIIEQDQNAP